MSETPVRPHFGSAYALTCFFVRMALFSVLATLGPQGFGPTLSAWLMLASLYCVVAAALRREPPWGRELTHFDEAAAAIGFAAWAS